MGEAAVAANIFTIAVNTGPLPDQVLLDAGADLLYPDMENLAKDWKQIIELAKSTRLERVFQISEHKKEATR